MGAATYNRGTKAIRAQIDRELQSRNRKPCSGVMYNGPDKRFTRCSKCGRIDYEQNEGDRCRVVFVKENP